MLLNVSLVRIVMEQGRILFDATLFSVKRCERLEVSVMRSSSVALLVLGAVIVVVGFLGLLNAAQVLLVDWHLVGSILGSIVAVSLGAWIILCSMQCYGPRRRVESS